MSPDAVPAPPNVRVVRAAPHSIVLSICETARVPDLQDLQQRALQAYQAALEETTVVTHASRTARSAMPILYFGDLEAYVASPVRIVTVGLNPSQAEFPLGSARGESGSTEDPWQRFPNAASGLPTTRAPCSL